MAERVVLPLIKDLSAEIREEYFAEVERNGTFKVEDISETDLFGSHFMFESTEKGEDYWFDVWSKLTDGKILSIDTEDLIIVSPESATLPAISKAKTITGIEKMILFKDGDLKEVVFDISEAKVDIIDGGKTLSVNLK